MRIKKFNVCCLSLPLSEPYSIAYGKFEAAQNIFVRLETDRGITGFGCAAPEEAVTGETADEVISALQNFAPAFLIGKPLVRWRKHVEALRRGPLLRKPSAQAAVEMAMLDALGKRCGMSVYQMWGGFRERIRTSVTIGICELDETVDRARHFVSQGFAALKIKGGQNVELDVARIHKVRETVGPQVELRFDANQGYSLESAKRFIEGTRLARVTVLEQPTDKRQLRAMGELMNSSPVVAVMADESLLTLRDAFFIAKRRFANMVNVKIMKVGGFSEAMSIGAIARASGLSVMVGCMDESALGIAAGLHFCLAHPDVALADLDGHFDLKNDPFASAVTCKAGWLYPAKEPGFGAVELHELNWD